MQAKTAGGIYLPETAVKELNEAKVLAVGPGMMDKDGKRIPMGVSAGDRVLIPQVGIYGRRMGDDTESSNVDKDPSSAAARSRSVRRSSPSSGTTSE
jgi:chaperonin GroES